MDPSPTDSSKVMLTWFGDALSRDPLIGSDETTEACALAGAAMARPAADSAPINPHRAIRRRANVLDRTTRARVAGHEVLGDKRHGGDRPGEPDQTHPQPRP